MSYVTRPLGGIVEDVSDRVERIVRAQVDRGVGVALDSAGNRFDRYLDSPEGTALLDKFEGKVETALVNVAYKRRWDIALAAASMAALVVAGVAVGSKVGYRGAGAAAGVGMALALPLLFAKDPEALPTKKLPPKRP